MSFPSVYRINPTNMPVNGISLGKPLKQLCRQSHDNKAICIWTYGKRLQVFKEKEKKRKSQTNNEIGINDHMDL